ncbi:hypothetical protein JXJ21_15760 [candidate division KSB1 bacterium]|nr:hypothetical protein [candidate division KSB1 bacterium]
MQKKRIILLGVLFILSIVVNCSKDKSSPTEPEIDPVPEPTEDFWKLKSDMPTAKYPVAVTVNDKIYLMGGVSNTKGSIIYTTVDEYDPATETWTAKAEMPRQRWCFAACALDGKIHVAGGKKEGGEEHVDSSAIDWHDVFDPQANTWETKASMEFPRMLLSLCALNGKLYAIGGVYNYHSLDIAVYAAVEEYDPATDTWTRKADLKTKRYSQEAQVAGGKIFVIGGNNVNTKGGTDVESTVEVYDSATDSWTAAPDIPTYRDAYRSGVIDGKIYVVGGYVPWSGTTAAIKMNEMFDPATNTWTEKADMKKAVNWPGVCACNGKLYVFGGGEANGYGVPPFAYVQEYTP